MVSICSKFCYLWVRNKIFICFVINIFIFLFLFRNPTPIKEDIFENVQWNPASESEKLFYLDFDKDLVMKTRTDEEDWVYWSDLFDSFGVPPYNIF